jgi:hypothetical protein
MKQTNLKNNVEIVLQECSHVQEVVISKFAHVNDLTITISIDTKFSHTIFY